MSKERVKDRKREGEREKERIKQITWAKIRDTTSTLAPSLRPTEIFYQRARFPEQRFWENWLDEKHALRISRPICGTPQNWKIRAAVRVRAFIAITMARRHATIRVADQRAESSRRRGSPPLPPTLSTTCAFSLWSHETDRTVTQGSCHSASCSPLLSSSRPNPLFQPPTLKHNRVLSATVCPSVRAFSLALARLISSSSSRGGEQCVTSTP